MAGPKKRSPAPSAVPPPASESDSLLEALGRARRDAETGETGLRNAIELLERTWRGAGKRRLLESLRGAAGELSGRLLPRLRVLEEKSRGGDADRPAGGNRPDAT